VGVVSHAINVRLPDDLIRRVDRVRLWLATQVPGATRTDAVRMVIQKGLEAMEAHAEGMTPEDLAWLDADLSRLGEVEPYDFGEANPDQLGRIGASPG
jgi:predicted DNA-binding protein